MATISISNALARLDSIAAKAVTILATFGADGSESGSIGESAIADRDAILALNDVNQENDLLGSFTNAVAKVLAANIYPVLQEGVRALDNHVGGLNTFLSDNDERVHWLIRTVFPCLSAANVFGPVVDAMATFTSSGRCDGRTNVDRPSLDSA